MKNLSCVLMLGILLLPGIGTARADQAVSKDAVLKAIAVFEKEPSSREGVDAATTIMSFAKKSTAVHISLSKAAVPWYKSQDAPDADTRGILLAAYVAGNISSQLKSGKAADDVYAGWQEVLATYAQLLRINPAAKLEEVDELKSKQADNSLRAHAAEVQKDITAKE